MTINQYVVGETVFLQDVITDEVTEVPLVDDTDALTVLYVPDRTVSTPAVTPVGGGIYTATFVPPLAGWYRYVFRSTGAAPGARKGSFWVSPTP